MEKSRKVSSIQLMKIFILRSITVLGILVILLTGFELITSKVIRSNSELQLNNQPKYLVLGHSHPEVAFNDSLINNLVNLSESGESFFYTYHKSKEIIASNLSIKTVFIEFTNNSIDKKMEDWTWDCNYMSSRFERFAPFIAAKDKLRLLSHNPSCFFSTFPLLLNERIDQLLKGDLNFSKKLGGYRVMNPKKAIVMDERLKELNEFDADTETFSKTNLDYLERLIHYCSKHNKRVILIRTPQRADYEFWGNEDRFQQIRKDRFADITFMDLSKFKLKDDEYSDPAHLNYRGSKRFSLWFNAALESPDMSALDSLIVR